MGLCRVSCLVSMSVVWTTCAPALGQADDALRRLADRYWDVTMERHPTWATSLGDYRFNDRLEDVSEAGRKQWQATLGALLKEVLKLSSAGLSADDRLTRDLLERAIRDELLRLECRLHYMPLEPLGGPQISFPLILVSQPFRDASDFKSYAARLRAFPKQVEDLITNMRTGVRRNLVSPRVIIEKVIPQIRAHIVDDTKQSEFYTPVEKAGRLSDADRKAAVTVTGGSVI